MKSEHARLQSGRDDRLHQRLASLEVFTADREFVLLGERHQRLNIDREIRCAVREGNT